MLLTRFFLIFLISFSLKAEPTVQKVAKTGDIDIPEGMHLIRTRTGERWLLPIGVNEVPEVIKDAEYFEQDNVVEKINRLGLDGHVSKPLSASDTFLNESEFWEQIPKHFADILHREKDHNKHGQSDHFSFLGKYGPSSKTPFYVPYIPIPVDEMEFSHIADFASNDTKELLKFESGGKTYYRFFIHPNYPGNYDELIEKHGIVYHYKGVTTSSPRSLIVMDPSEKNSVHWIKPSLPKKIDGSVRLNIDTKLRRAVIMSEALEKIPAHRRAQYNVEFMLEPAAMQPKGKTFGTIHREVHEELLFPAKGKSWMPAFALNSNGASGKPILLEMVEKSGKSHEEFIKNDIIRPFLKSYLSLGLLEGLPGEFHTQNFYYELDDKGLPTGRFLFKDNDGFRFDVEMAMRKSRPLKYLSKFAKPFYWAKFSNALGTGGEGIPFLGSWYYKLIRNVGGFETLSSYVLGVMKSVKGETVLWSKKGIQTLFDDIALEVAQELTGISVSSENRYGFGKGKGLNRVLQKFRYSQSRNDFDEAWSETSFQNKLKKHFVSLKEDGRAHLRSSLSVHAVYVPRVMSDGTIVIEARRLKVKEGQDSIIGLAIINEESPLSTTIKKEIFNLLTECLN